MNKPFVILHVESSDGDENTHPKIRTKPTPNAKGAYDYFRPIAPGENKDMLWRSKLASTLVKEFNIQNPHPGEPLLASLPRGYALFEHIKCNGGVGTPPLPTSGAICSAVAVLIYL